MPAAGGKSGDDPAVALFGHALTLTTQALSHDFETQVAFDGLSDAKGTRGDLPAIVPVMSRERLTGLRGKADKLAFTRAFHDPDLHARLRPQVAEASSAFDETEAMRTMILGARLMLGARANLRAHVESDLVPHLVAQKNLRGRLEPHETVALALWEEAFGEQVPGELTKPVRAHLCKGRSRILGALLAQASDQEAFARGVRKALARLGVLAEEDRGEEGDESSEDISREETSSASSDAFDGTVSADLESDDADEAQGEEAGEVSPEDQVDQVSRRDRTHLDGDTSALEPEPAGLLVEDSDAPYRVFDTRFDEVVTPGDLADREELARLRDLLDQRTEKSLSVVSRLANRLQRRLLAQQNRSWHFNLDEGQLDTARLARIVTRPGSSLAFKRESALPFRDTIVTLLIDNSGSMRGRPIVIAALSTEIIAATLERCSVQTEVIGFTTVNWKGGSPRTHWLESGKPARPGRLNALRHILYKSASEPWRRARKSLGLMLREGLLKENIDGEALQFAARRLLEGHQARKILMVISDGAPVDDATLSANGPQYLERHLGEVIGAIESEGKIELIAIGVGHDVSRYYKRAIVIDRVEDLGTVIVNELAELFDVKA